MLYRESEQIELKQIINQDFKKEVIAFANTDGGTIFIGVADDGSIVGITDASRVEEQVCNIIRDSIKPDLSAYTRIQIIEDDGKQLVRIDVQSGLKKPYHTTEKGLKPSGVFVRHGTSSVPASEDTIRQMLRDTDGTTFDKARCINQDLTFTYAQDFFQKRNLAFEDSQKRTLGLYDSDGYFTNAAFLLSDQCGHIIRCGVYDGVTKEKFKDRREFGGSILKQLDDAYTFLELNNQLCATFSGLYRTDTQSYPPQALREALINAVVHRDYDYTGSIIINLFDDRAEFVSIGGLVKGITIEDVFRGVSQPRNMLIASIFYRLELIESYGTGIGRMLSNYRDCPLKPSFLPGPASFVVVLPNKNHLTDTSTTDVDVMPC